MKNFSLSFVQEKPVNLVLNATHDPWEAEKVDPYQRHLKYEP